VKRDFSVQRERNLSIARNSGVDKEVDITEREISVHTYSGFS
jgi:hypothetical protein